MAKKQKIEGLADGLLWFANKKPRRPFEGRGVLLRWLRGQDLDQNIQ